MLKSVSSAGERLNSFLCVKVLELLYKSHVKFRPIEPLRQDVHVFWHLEGAQEVYNQRDIVPDSYRELIINLGAPILFETGRGLVRMPRVFLCPLQQRPHRFFALGACQIIGISMYPWTVPTLLGEAAALESTSHVALGTAWQDFAAHLDLVAHRLGPAEAVGELQEFVRDLWQPLPTGLAPLRDFGQGIVSGRGDVSLADLALRSALSTSRLERLFKQVSAVPPKTYARLVRFEAVRNALVREPDGSLAELAYDLGFSDQAHLTHEFKTFAGLPPGAFAQQMRAYKGSWHESEFLQYP